MTILKKALFFTIALLMAVSMLPISVSANNAECAGCESGIHIQGCPLWGSAASCNGSADCPADSHDPSCLKAQNMPPQEPYSLDTSCTHSFGAWNWSAEERTFLHTCTSCSAQEKNASPEAIRQLMTDASPAAIRSAAAAAVTDGIITQDAADQVITILGIGTADTFAASVGDVKYGTLQAAVLDAAAGSNIILLSDTAESQVRIPSGKRIIINFSTRTLNGSIFVEKGAHVQLLNGSIKETSGTNPGLEVQGQAVLTQMKITSASHTIRVNGLESEGTSLTVNSGTYQATASRGIVHTLVAKGGASVTIEDGEFLGVGLAESAAKGYCVMVEDSQTAVHIKGGYFHGSNFNAKKGAISVNTGLRISGGVYAIWAYDQYLTEYKAAQYILDGMYRVVDAAAMIGDKCYPTLQDAVDAATDGQTVLLLKDVSEENVLIESVKDIVIDLKGKTVTGNLLVNGKVTLRDGSIMNTEGVSGITVNDPNANLTVEYLDITTSHYVLDAIRGNVTISRGNFTASGTSGVLGLHGGHVNITDGTFSASGNAPILDIDGSQTSLITGGWYSKEPERFIGRGLAAQFSSDKQLYGIVPAVAEIDEKGYLSLNAAFESARDGDTIRLLQDITNADIALDTAATPKEVTLDVNGEYLNATITFASEASRLTILNSGDGNTITLKTAGEKRGHTPLWDDGKLATAQVEASTLAISGPAGNGNTYSFSWKVNCYIITFDPDNGSVPTPFEQDYGTQVSAPSDPTKPGYTFDKWVDAAGNEVHFPLTVSDQNMTITAVWTINQYTLTFYLDATSNAVPYETIQGNFGTAVTAPNDPTKTGHTFTGWATSEGTAAVIPATIPSENRTFLAQWQANQYTIRFDTDGGSEVTSITQAFGSQVAAPSNPSKENHVFTGWVDGDGDPVTFPFTMPVDGMTIKATWRVNGYTIAYNANRGTGTMASTAAEYGRYVTLRTNTFTRTNYRFAGWALEADAEAAQIANGASVLNLSDRDGAVVTLYAVWADKDVLTPDTTPQIVTYNGRVQNFVTADSRICVSYQPATRSTTDTSRINVGVYNVILSAEATETTAAYRTVIPGGLVIVPATLTASYASETIYAGQSPLLRVAVTGFVDGETPLNASGYKAPTVSGAGLGIGSHILTPSGGEAQNYLFANVPGTLTIREKVIYVYNPDTLLQTGQHNWPIPVMAMLGTAALAIGTWFLMCRKKEHYEK